jgi:hypothetical protein
MRSCTPTLTVHETGPNCKKVRSAGCRRESDEPAGLGGLLQGAFV